MVIGDGDFEEKGGKKRMVKVMLPERGGGEQREAGGGRGRIVAACLDPSQKLF